MKCGQHGCENAAAYQYYWMSEPHIICEEHKNLPVNIGRALGMTVTLTPLEPESDD